MKKSLSLPPQIDKVWAWLRKYGSNKYSLTLAIALVWMLFFDRYDMAAQLRFYDKIAVLENEITYYKEQITLLRAEKDLLKFNRVALEKFARERYLMKRPNEDLFIITHSDKKTANPTDGATQ
jgi:cell division protein FtsB